MRSTRRCSRARWRPRLPRRPASSPSSSKRLRRTCRSGRNKAYSFMLEPLMMPKEVFPKLHTAHQAILIAVGVEQEKFGTEAGKAEDGSERVRQGGRKGLGSRRRGAATVAGDRARHPLERVRGAKPALRVSTQDGTEAGLNHRRPPAYVAQSRSRHGETRSNCACQAEGTCTMSLR